MTVTERYRLEQENDVPPHEIFRGEHPGHLLAECEERRQRYGSARMGVAGKGAIDRFHEELAEAFNEGLARTEAKNQRRLWLEKQREKPRKKRA